MGPTGSDIKVLQVHPSLRCNLRCQHCYSSSSPTSADALDMELLLQAVSDAAAEGYNVLGVSGGEPLLVAQLPALLGHAHALGMTATVTTNGMLLNERRVAQLCGAADLVAISLDGAPASHNRMRGTPQAFAMMHQRLELLRRAQLRFGFIFTLTLHNLHELEEVARYAIEQGAALLQVHPLEEVGRAQEQLSHAAPDRLELTYAFLEVARLRKLFAGQIKIQFDVVDMVLLRDEPERVFAGATPAADVARQPLADLVSPLVIEADGWVVPIQYGFSHDYGIGDLHTGRLREHAALWKTRRYDAFLALCRATYDEMCEQERPELPFMNWYGQISQASRSAYA